MKDSLRCDGQEQFTYHDRVFDSEMNHIINQTEEAYENLMFREAMKHGFYDLQAARDRYRDITTAGDGMNWTLVHRFIKVQPC